MQFSPCHLICVLDGNIIFNVVYISFIDTSNIYFGMSALYQNTKLREIYCIQ